MKPAVASRRVWAIVPAAGRGARFAASAASPAPKQYAPLLGATVLEWSLRALLAEPRVQAVVVALAPEDAYWAGVAARLSSSKLQTAPGGANRQDSVMNALDKLATQAAANDWILVHDAARPCLNAADLEALLNAVGAAPSAADDGENPGGAVLGAPIVDTVKRELGSRIATVDREGLWRALTPQVFAFAGLRRALKEAALAGLVVTDEAQAMERIGVRPVLVQGSPFNVKITCAADLETAASLLKMTEVMPMRVGQGFDVHAFGPGDHVILGGVRIAHTKGVIAHSDGDVVIHALCDALLGALGDGDIGRHFPDSDPKYRGADSRVFLRAVAARVQAAGLRLVNADITVLAEAPRIAAHRDAMAAALSADLGVPSQLVNVKATTTERMGFIGRGEGLAALASVLLGR
ncbi:MAG: bifunctional 2-C-methyl-D-erythritol 4-phosphate cytidylyltransferase/2-C-methyl-D-erythritol 2,4-cyclodiphosphate synthase [Steroidobacteraceae bacterium]